MINFREKVIIIKRYKSVWEPKTRVSINMKDTRRNSRKRRCQEADESTQVECACNYRCNSFDDSTCSGRWNFSSGEGEKLFGSGDGA